MSSRLVLVLILNYLKEMVFYNRHQARESEPKDYSISTDPVRNLKRATYDRLASITDGVRTN